MTAVKQNRFTRLHPCTCRNWLIQHIIQLQKISSFESIWLGGFAPEHPSKPPRLRVPVPPRFGTSLIMSLLVCTQHTFKGHTVQGHQVGIEKPEPKWLLIGNNLESARIIKKCPNDMICATMWNFRSCFEKVYRSYWSPFISVSKEGAGRHPVIWSQNDWGVLTWFPPPWPLNVSRLGWKFEASESIRGFVNLRLKLEEEKRQHRWQV